MITAIEDYFVHGCGRCPRFATDACSARKWAAGLAELRRICRAAGLSEAVKWGHPCYMHGARNIALIGALQGDFRISFFQSALLKDPAGVLEHQGPNSANRDVIRFTSAAQVVALEPVLAAYLAEAVGYADAGVLPAKVASEMQLPEELVAALDDDPALAEAFHALTPGRQKSYALAIGSAKASATRTARIEKYRDKIIAGKGAMDR